MAPRGQEDLLIKSINGSFSCDLKKYNVAKEKIESNFNNYFSLSPNNTFKKISETKDDLGFTHVNYQQLYSDIPVDGAIVMLHLKNAKPNSLNGQIAEIKNLNTKAVISSPHRNLEEKKKKI